MTTLHPCSGVVTGHREDGSKVQMNALVCFGGLDPSSRKPVSGAVLHGKVAMRRRSPARRVGESVVSSAPHHSSISTAFRTPTIILCTAIQAFNCLLFHEADRSARAYIQVPAAHSRIPTVLLYSEYSYSERTLVTVLFATDKLKTISAISQGHHQVSF